jgi:hypothetical protein
LTFAKQNSEEVRLMNEQLIPIRHVADAASAAAWYQRLGFQKEWEHRFEPHLPAFVSIAKDAVRMFLSEHKGDARPDTPVYLWVQNVFPIAKDFQVKVDEQPWAHEIELRDPDGNRLRIGTPKA